MNKAYNPINWVNNETPINETNLNKMSNGLSAVDDRVIALNKTLGSYSDKINEALEASVVAQDAKEIALESAEKAEEALKNAEAVVGVGIATKDKAGLVKADDVHIASDGTLKFIEKTTSTTMPNSHKGRLMFEEIGGVSEQESTTGTQLFDSSELTDTESLQSLVVNENVITLTGIAAYARATYYIKNITSHIGQSITLSCTSISKSTDANIAVQFIASYNDGTASKYYPMTSSGLVTMVVPENIKSLRVQIVCNNRATALEIANTMTVTDLMVSVGTTALPWEKYTGGIPAPNPEYPQEIKKSVVGEIKTHGKNFLDCRGLEKQTINGVTFTPVYDNNGNLLYIEANGTATDGIGYYCGYHSMKNGIQYTLSGCSTGGAGGSTYQLQVANFGGDNGSGITNTYDSATMDTRVVIYIFSGYTATNLRFYPMIRKADIADDTYEPYTESSITLSQPIDLYGIGDEQDIMDAKKIEWRFKYRRLTSADNWRLGNGNWYWTSAISDMLVDTSFQVAHRVKAALCTHFVYEEDYGLLVNETNNGISMFKADYGYRTLVHDDRFSSLNEFTTWLDANEVYIAYQLATPTTESLPIADQIALNSLATYDGITYLEFDSEIEPTFKDEYGTSKVGGYTLEGLLTGRNAELLQQSNADRITALETALINNV